MTYNEGMDVSDAAEKAALRTGTKSRAFTVGFFGPRHDADAGDGFAKAVIPVVGFRNECGAIGDGGGAGHDRKNKERMRRERAELGD